MEPSAPLPNGDTAAPGFIVLRTGDELLPLLARLLLGGVVLFEGARKFTDPMGYGIGRFEALGFPFPGFFAPLVGGFEVACALLLLLGLGVRVAAFPPLTILLAALVVVRRMDPVGALYELTLAGLAVFLLVRGGGRLSMDRAFWVGAERGGDDPAAASPFTHREADPGPRESGRESGPGEGDHREA